MEEQTEKLQEVILDGKKYTLSEFQSIKEEIENSGRGIDVVEVAPGQYKTRIQG